MDIRRNFSTGGNIDNLLIVLLTNGRSLKVLLFLYRKKFPMKARAPLTSF